MTLLLLSSTLSTGDCYESVVEFETLCEEFLWISRVSQSTDKHSVGFSYAAVECQIYCKTFICSSRVHLTPIYVSQYTIKIYFIFL